jgi:hypothetical protein
MSSTKMPQDVKPPREEIRERDHLFRSPFFKITSLFIAALFIMWMIMLAFDIAGGNFAR